MNKKQVIALCITLAFLVLVMLFPAQQAVRKTDGMLIKPLYVYSIFRSGEIHDCCRYDRSYCDYAGYYIEHDEPAMCLITINFLIFMGEVLLVILLGGFSIYFLGNKEI
jgi:hypothetical protein